jgi:heme oxygenase
MRALTASDVTEAVYCHVLLRFHRFYGLHEAGLERSLRREKCPAYRPRLPLLEHDMICAGITPPCDIPLSDDPFPPARMLGWLYVIEGSMLGGSFIAKHLRSHLGVKHPYRFLVPYGRKCAVQWHGTRRYLQQRAEEQGMDLHAIAMGAVECFRRLNECLRGDPG